MVEKSGLRTAYHEAGHAVVGLDPGLDMYNLTITPAEDYSGVTHIVRVRPEDSDYQRVVVMTVPRQQIPVVTP
jgi:ATP-dependent Zn protease